MNLGMIFSVLRSLHLTYCPVVHEVDEFVDTHLVVVHTVSGHIGCFVGHIGCFAAYLHKSSADPSPQEPRFPFEYSDRLVVGLELNEVVVCLPLPSSQMDVVVLCTSVPWHSFLELTDFCSSEIIIVFINSIIDVDY